MSMVSLKRVRDFGSPSRAHAKKHFTTEERAAFDDHGWFCHYCASEAALTADHIIPRIKGGGDEASNLVPACASCNVSRGKRDYADFLEIIRAELAAYSAMQICGDCL